MDRDQDHDVSNTVPTTSTKATLFPAANDKYCPVTLMALTYDWSALNKKIDSMTPDGNTNQTIGLAWGWQALTQGAPLSPPPPEKDAQRVIVLLTDGLNTQNRWSSNVSVIDARTEKTCANIKAAGITLYTVQVKGNGDPTSAILQKCASDSKKFFALTSANEIVSTFNTIGTNLSQLRLAK
jgi:Mg-chelatase subunit ChlD